MSRCALIKILISILQKKFCFSAGSLFFAYSQPLEVSNRKMGFGGVSLKQRSCENARKLVKRGPKNGPDFFTHAQCMYANFCATPLHLQAQANICRRYIHRYNFVFIYIYLFIYLLIYLFSIVLHEINPVNGNFKLRFSVNL